MVSKKDRRSTKRRSANIGQQIQNYLKKHSEHKFKEIVVSYTNGTAWGVTPISQVIIQGTTGADRIGDNVTYVMLHLFGRITIHPSAAVTNVRFVLVLDKMCDSIAPTYADLFNLNTIDSGYSPEQIKAKRFTILMDKSYALNIQGIAAHMFNMKMRLNQTATFNGVTNATASNGKNSMWLFVVSDNGTNEPSINCDFQVEFMDP